MPNTANTVNFGNLTALIAPDVAAEQLALQRRQAIVDLLKKQALDPIESQTVTGAGPARVVPTNPLTGLAKMLTAYTAGQQQDDIDQRTLGMQRAYAQRMADVLSGGQGNTPTLPSPASVALAQGASQGDLGPTNSNAQRLGAMLSSNGPSSAPAPAAPGFDLGSLVRGAVAADLGGNSAADAYWSNAKLPDSVKTNNFYGVNPNTVRQGIEQESRYKGLPTQAAENAAAGVDSQTAHDARIAELRKNGALSVRPENTVLDFSQGVNGTPIFTAPDANGTGGFLTWNNGNPSVAPITGAAPTIRATTSARTAGQADESFTNVTLPDGRVVPVRGKDIPNALSGLPAAQPGIQPGTFQGSPDQVLAQIADIKDPQERANAYSSYMQQLGRPASPQLGQSTQDKVTQEANAKMLQELPQQMLQSKQTVAGLENAYRMANTSGPGVSRAANVTAILNNMGFPVAKDDTTNYQTLKKFLENSASSAAAANGFTGSDARFEQFKAGQPNAETMNPDALKGAIRYVLSQHDAAIARGGFIQKQVAQNAGDPNAAQQATTEWSRAYNPQVFEFNRMSPTERAAFKAQLAKNPAAFQQFGQQYNFAHSQGWVN